MHHQNQKVIIIYLKGEGRQETNHIAIFIFYKNETMFKSSSVYITLYHPDSCLDAHHLAQYLSVIACSVHEYAVSSLLHEVNANLLVTD